MDMIILGTGVLSWQRYERQTDRYGTVNLAHGTSHEHLVVFGDTPPGRRGTLIAVVLDTRQSPHCGDWARGFAPTTPTVGDRITLGTGTLIAESPDATGCATEIGMRPDDGREADWLDPEALYRCHHQTVRLELHPQPPAPSHRDDEHQFERPTRLEDRSAT